MRFASKARLMLHFTLFPAPVTSRHSTVYSLPTSAKHSVMASDKSVGPPIWATILEEKLSQQHKVGHL